MHIPRRTALAAALAGILVAVPAAPAGAEDGLNFDDYVDFQSFVAVDVDEYWAQESAARDIPYLSPDLVFTPPGSVSVSGCGAVSGDPAEVNLPPGSAEISPAFYCPADVTVYLSSAWMYREIYGGTGDFAAAVVIAHEWAHHTQTVSGTTNRGTKANELQADCWAGTWASSAESRGLLEDGDLGEGGAALYKLGDFEFDSPDHHGTPKERLRWFAQGYGHADPGECNP